jgi:hypothetical protein
VNGGLVDLNDWSHYRDVDRMHALGSRVLYEFLNELGSAALCRIEIDRIISRYVIVFCPPKAHR